MSPPCKVRWRSCTIKASTPFSHIAWLATSLVSRVRSRMCSIDSVKFIVQRPQGAAASLAQQEVTEAGPFIHSAHERVCKVTERVARPLIVSDQGELRAVAVSNRRFKLMCLFEGSEDRTWVVEPPRPPALLLEEETRCAVDPQLPIVLAELASLNLAGGASQPGGLACSPSAWLQLPCQIAMSTAPVVPSFRGSASSVHTPPSLIESTSEVSYGPAARIKHKYKYSSHKLRGGGADHPYHRAPPPAPRPRQPQPTQSCPLLVI